VRSERSEPSGFGILSQWIRADRYRDKRLRVSAFLKSEGVGPTRRSGARLDVVVFSRTRRLGGSSMFGRLVQGTTDWTKYEQVLDVPQEAVLVFVGVVLIGPGQVWVDDVRIETVGRDVPATVSSSRRPELSERMRQRVESRLRSAQARPVNLNFEK
jgi:hypothetical protein